MRGAIAIAISSWNSSLHAYGINTCTRAPHHWRSTSGGLLLVQRVCHMTHGEEL